MGAIKQSVTQGLTTVQLLYSQSAAYAAKKEEAAAKVQEKRRAAEYKKASEELDPAIEKAQEELKTKKGNIEHKEDIVKYDDESGKSKLLQDTEATISLNREAEIAAEVLGGLQQAKAQAAFKAGEYGDYASSTAGARDTEYARSGYKKEQVSAEQSYKEQTQEQNRRWKELELKKLKKLKSQKLKYIRAQQKAKEDMALQDKKNKILLYDQYGEVIR